jgi:hypothetical protein
MWVLPIITGVVGVLIGRQIGQAEARRSPAGRVVHVGRDSYATGFATPTAVSNFKRSLATQIHDVALRVTDARPHLDGFTAKYWDAYWSRWLDFYNRAPGWLDASDQQTAAEGFARELPTWRAWAASVPPTATTGWAYAVAR